MRYTVIALKRYVEIDKVQIHTENIYDAIDIAENYWKDNFVEYDMVVVE